MSRDHGRTRAEEFNKAADDVAETTAGGIGAQETGNDLWTIAVHEAAHAVVGRLLGIDCGGVTIKPEDGISYGSAVIDDPRFSWKRGDGPKRKLATNFALALYAGAEAERLLLGLEPTLDGVDRIRATDCLAWAGAVPGAVFVGDENFDRHEAHLRVRASSLVRQHAETIRAVADALLNQVTLSSDEVDAITEPMNRRD